MTALRIEHVNVTVSEPERTAKMLERVFGWHVRWQGPARDGGRTIHVGSSDAYVALYKGRDAAHTAEGFAKGRPLNHIGVEVEDLDTTEERVIETGLTPFSHGDYEPGRRFYFFDPDGIEYEVVSYQPAALSRPPKSGHEPRLEELSDNGAEGRDQRTAWPIIARSVRASSMAWAYMSLLK